MRDTRLTRTRQPKVILHIGAPKTGSSYIQSSLVLSRDALAAAGIRYPEHWSDDAAAAGHTTSGNIDAFDGKHVRDVILCELDQLQPGMHTLLYSNEMLPGVLSENVSILRDVLSVAQVEVIAFVREPVEWVVSTYAQHVQGKGLSQEISEFIPHWRPPVAALTVFAQCESLGIPLTVRNYSATKNRLLEVFENAVSPDQNLSLTAPPRRRVNRSLTVSEIALQRAVNVSGLPHPEAVADALVNHLPDIPVAPHELSAKCYAILVDHFSEVFKEIARFVPDDEIPSFAMTSDWRDGYAPDENSEYTRLTFSQAQVEVIVETVARLATLKPERVSHRSRLTRYLRRTT